jgi:hypothetical protein
MNTLISEKKQVSGQKNIYCHGPESLFSNNKVVISSQEHKNFLIYAPHRVSDYTVKNW